MTQQADKQNFQSWLKTLHASVRGSVARTARTESSTASWTLVVVPDAGDVSFAYYDTPEELATAIATYEGKDVTVLMYYGTRLWLSAGPNRCLILPSGKEIPVAGLGTHSGIDATGYLGGPEPAFTPDVSEDEEDSDEYEVEYDDPEDVVATEEPS